MNEHTKYATFYQVRTSFIHFLVPGNIHNNHVRVSYTVKYILLNIPTPNQTYLHKTFQYRYSSINLSSVRAHITQFMQFDSGSTLVSAEKWYRYDKNVTLHETVQYMGNDFVTAMSFRQPTGNLRTVCLTFRQHTHYGQWANQACTLRRASLE